MKLTVFIRKKHFKNNKYGSISNCPLAKAYKEQFQSEAVSVGTITLSDYTKKIFFGNFCYSLNMYKWDKFKSLFLFKNSIVRKVTIEKQ